MKLCPKCNYSNQDFDTVCNSCGSPLDSVNQPGMYGMNTGNFNNPDFNGMSPPMPVRTNGMAIASMVLGIISILLDCCWGIGIIPAILAVIFGFLSRKSIRESSGRQVGEGMALAGIILGFVGIAVGIVAILYCVAIVSTPDFWDRVRERMEGNNYNR